MQCNLPSIVASTQLTPAGCFAYRYVALRNINVIVQKYPDLLANEVKVLFCR